MENLDEEKNLLEKVLLDRTTETSPRITYGENKKGRLVAQSDEYSCHVIRKSFFYSCPHDGEKMVKVAVGVKTSDEKWQSTANELICPKCYHTENYVDTMKLPPLG